MMSPKLYASVLLALSTLSGLAQSQTIDPSIETPTGVTQCQITSLNFFSSHPPVTISAIPGAQVGSAPIEQIVQTVGSPYAWLVNMPNGTYFTLQIRDSLGGLQYSGPITVLNSANHSCVGSNPNGATVTTGTIPLPSAASGASLPPNSASTTPAGTTNSGTTTGPTSAPPSSAAPSNTAPASTTSTKSAGVKLTAAKGMAVSAGLIIAGLAMSL